MIGPGMMTPGGMTPGPMAPPSPMGGLPSGLEGLMGPGLNQQIPIEQILMALMGGGQMENAQGSVPPLYPDGIRPQMPQGGITPGPFPPQMQWPSMFGEGGR